MTRLDRIQLDRIQLDSGLKQAFAETADLKHFVYIQVGLGLEQVNWEQKLPNIRLDIIVWLESHSTEIPRFLRRAWECRPDSKEFREAALGLVPEPQRSRLLALEPILNLAAVKAGEVARAYERSVPPRWEERLPHSGSYAAFSYAASIAGLSSGGADPDPLLRFALLLEQGLREKPGEGVSPQDAAAAADRLAEWLAESITLLAPDEATRRAWREGLSQGRGAAAGAPAPDPRLLVMVLPAESSARTFHVRAWLLGTDRDRAMEEGHEAHPAARVPGVVRALVGRLEDEPIPPGQIRVELMGPRPIICQAVDQWELESLEIPIPMGSQHPLVVRLLKRKAIPQRHAAALAAAGLRFTLTDRLPPAGGSPTAWRARPGCGTPAQILARLRLGENQAVACCLLDDPPDPDGRGDALSAVLSAGIPVVVWLRQSPPDARAAARAEEAVKRLLDGRALVDLPARAYDLRLEADSEGAPAAGPRARGRRGGGGDWHPGRHVTVLWDDPARPPPDYDDDARMRYEEAG